MNWDLRRLATAAAASADASNLPLAGIKVLDMTRVLAGVCFEAHVLAKTLSLTLHSHTAHKFLEILGTPECTQYKPTTEVGKPQNNQLTQNRADVIKIEHPTRGGKLEK